MEGWLRDLRVGWRSLARTPGFTFVVVAVLGLGIGANTMIFNVANAFLFRKLPYLDAQRNVDVVNTDPKQHQDEVELSYPDLFELRDRARSFDALGGYYETMIYATLGRDPERFEATAITAGFLRVFGTAPALGREFRRDEEPKERSYTVAMISDRVWRERFGADLQVVGRTIKMNGRMRTIVGVMPPQFRFPETADVFIPAPYDPVEDKGDSFFLRGVARLKPGVTVAAANAEVAAMAAERAKRDPETHANIGGRAVAFRERIVGDMRPILAVLMAAVGFVLLIACANVANLMLARGATRQREIALRFALGATRGHIVRQLLAESAIVAALGGALGLLLAMWGRDLVIGSIPTELPFWMKFDTDPNTVLFMLGAAGASAILAGLVPAWQTSQVDVHDALKEGSHQGTAGRARSRLRSALVVAEVALSVILLTGAGLMIRSFLNMAAQGSLIRSEGVLTGRITLPIAVYKDDASRSAFMDALMPAIQGMPSVRSASLTTVIPLSNNAWRTAVLLEHETDDRNAPRRVMLYALVRPGYFSTMGIPLRAGRDFSPADGPGTPRVAIVSESAARKLWPGQDPLGKRFGFAGHDTTGLRTVIGVAADVRQQVKDKAPPAQVYMAHMQDPTQTVTLVIRHDGDAGAMTAALRRLIQSRDPDMPLYDVRTMEESLRYGLWEQRIYVALMSVFAVLALVIAAIGIYGVMAYSVAQRTQEIGIRMALGAARSDVLRLVVGQAMRLTVLGLGIGLAGAYGVTRLMASLLFGVSTSDPPTFVGVALILGLSGVLAAWLPAERATRVHPMEALRAE